MSDAQDSPVTLPGPLIEVDDPSDPRLELYRDLNDPAGRIRRDSDHAAFVVEGRLAVTRLLSSPYTIRSLLIDDHQVSLASDLVTTTRARGGTVFVGSRALVAGTVGFALHRGVVAIANRPLPADAASLLHKASWTPGSGRPAPVVAVLEGLNDHQNIGALFRNAAAFGVSGVLLDPTCADPLYRRAIRVSVGHALHIPFARLVPWPSGLDDVRAAGFMVAALAPHPVGQSRKIPTLTLAQLASRTSNSDDHLGLALLLGAEGLGLTDAALAAADVVVSIPIADAVDSLNVATAAAIAFHALNRF